MECNPRYRCREQASFRFFDFSPALLRPYTFWAGLFGGTFSHYRQSRHRSTDRATSSCGAEPAGVGKGIDFKRGCGSFSVCDVPDRGRDAVRLLSRAHGDLWQEADRIYPTFIVSKMPHGISGSADRGDPCCGHVEPKRRAEFPIVKRDHGFLRAFPAANRRTKADAILPSGNVLLGVALVWAGRAFSPQSWPRGRSGIANCFRGLRRFCLEFSCWACSPAAPIKMEPCSACFTEFATELYLWLGTRVPWTWWVAIGTSVTFALGYLASLCLGKNVSGQENL